MSKNIDMTADGCVFCSRSMFHPVMSEIFWLLFSHTTREACDTTFFLFTLRQIWCVQKNISMSAVSLRTRPFGFVHRQTRNAKRTRVSEWQGTRAHLDADEWSRPCHCCVRWVCVYSVLLVCFQGCGLRSTAFTLISRKWAQERIFHSANVRSGIL